MAKNLSLMEKSSEERLDILDFWRGIAVVLVIAVHCPTGKFEFEFISNLIGSLYIGVILFFILSGITINLNWDKKYINDKNGLVKFIISRLFRIVPLYWIGIIFYHFVFKLNTPFEGIFLNIILSNWLNDTYNSSVVPGGWSISTEVYFYLFFIISIKWINTTQKSIVCWIVSLFCSKGLLYIFALYNINISFIHNPISQLPNFLLGSIFYFFVIKKDKKINSNLIVGFLIILFLDKSNASIIQQWVEFGLILFLAIFYLYKKVDLINALALKVFIRLGKVSYSMYLLHFFIIHILNITFNLNYSQSIVFIIRFVLVLTFTYVLSEITYRFIEIPFIKLGKTTIALIYK